MIAISPQSPTCPSPREWLGERDLRCVRHFARLVKRRMQHCYLDCDDIEQELAMHLWRRLCRYLPERSSRGTFIRHVLRNKAASILRDQGRKKRMLRLAPLEEVEDPSWPVEPVSGCAVCSLSTSSAQCRVDMALDLAAAIVRLPPCLRQLCSLLGTMPQAELRRRLGLSKHQFYRRLNWLRRRFSVAGLDPSN